MESQEQRRGLQKREACSLLISQGCSGSGQDEDLVSTSQAHPSILPLRSQRAVGLGRTSATGQKGPKVARRNRPRVPPVLEKGQMHLGTVRVWHRKLQWAQG